MTPAPLDAPWTQAVATDTRVSCVSGPRVVEFYSFSPVQRSSDLHTVLQTSGESELLILHCDGLYSVQADAPVENFTSMTGLENPVPDRARRERFFLDAHDAARVHPSCELVRDALTQSLERLINPRPPLPAAFGLVDLGCGRADRLETFAHEHPDVNVLGVDFKPPLYAPAPNVSFWRGSANDALRKLIDAQVRVTSVNTDFLFGNLETGSPEELLDNVTELLPPGGEFTVSTLKVLAYALGEQLANAGFRVGILETDEGFDDIRQTQTGQKIVDKFLATGLPPDSDQTPVRLIATKK